MDTIRSTTTDMTRLPDDQTGFLELFTLIRLHDVDVDLCKE